MIVRTVTRRRMRQMRIRANRLYRTARRPSVWNALGVVDKVWLAAMLECVGSRHRLPGMEHWGSNMLRRVRFVARGTDREDG